jgi:DNA-binding transcriptional ArsR family regulator
MNISNQENSSEKLAELFQILSQPSRLNILMALGAGEACVCHLEALLGERQAYISQQLVFLKEAGLVDFRRDGRNMYYHLSDHRSLDVIKAAGITLDSKFQLLSIPNPVPGCPCPHCNPGVKECPPETEGEKPGGECL